MAPGDRVLTPHGYGTVTDREEFRTCCRVGVKLDNNPFSWPIAWYFEKEVRKCH